MEPYMPHETFGRQPQPVTVVVQDGEAIDIGYWRNLLQRFAANHAANVQVINHQSFRIYPNAVNE
jgi:hypothetical protein